MIFTEENIEKIRNGNKTVTRRLWKKPHVRVDGIYKLHSSRFSKTPDDAVTIRITSVSTERLGDIVDREMANEANREGCNTIPEFVAIWRELHGEWNPDVIVYRIAFRYLGIWRR